MYKIVFLDFDGVIITHRVVAAYPEKGIYGFDPIAIGMLNRLPVLDKTVRFVLSTSWRRGSAVRDYLTIAGFKGPYFDKFEGQGRGINSSWKTQHLPSGHRGEEIQDWLDTYKEYVTHYAVLDDSKDMLPGQSDNWISCDYHDGLSYDNFRKLKQVLHIE